MRCYFAFTDPKFVDSAIKAGLIFNTLLESFTCKSNSYLKKSEKLDFITKNFGAVDILLMRIFDESLKTSLDQTKMKLPSGEVKYP